MLKQPHGLAEHRAADALPRDQLGLGAYELARLQAVVHYLLGDPAGDGLGPLAVA